MPFSPGFNNKVCRRYLSESDTRRVPTVDKNVSIAQACLSLNSLTCTTSVLNKHKSSCLPSHLLYASLFFFLQEKCMIISNSATWASDWGLLNYDPIYLCTEG